jgi:hypothetical protein
MNGSMLVLQGATEKFGQNLGTISVYKVQQ